MTHLEHRGWTISANRWPEPNYTAISPDYDASFEDGEWQDNGQRAEGRTLDEVKAEIDAWFEEHSQ